MPGMIVGVPIFAIIYAGIRAAVNIRLEKRELPCETMAYEKLDYIDEEGIHPITEETKRRRRRRRKSGAEGDKEEKDLETELPKEAGEAAGGETKAGERNHG